MRKIDWSWSKFLEDYSSRTMPIPESGCLIWLGIVQGNGYGRYWRNSVAVGVHRLIWEFHNGQIPEGKIITHKCDEPNCVNISHLELGTYNSNNKQTCDRRRKYSRPNKGRYCKGILTELFI